MTFADETLMAYADGELDSEVRAAVEAAMAKDPEVAQRIAQHQALRLSLQSAFEDVLAEPLPPRLVNAARSGPVGARENNIAALASARAARVKSATRAAQPRGAWAQWGAIAASLIIGLIVGRFLPSSAENGPFVARAGQLLARGALAEALATQLASNQPRSSAAQIGISFRARSGEYCRTFVLGDAQSSGSTLAGLACHENGAWRVELLAPGESRVSGSYRMAGSEMPKALLQALQDRIAGEPLDARSEAAARQHRWQP